jgi:hypothetical protein
VDPRGRFGSNLGMSPIRITMALTFGLLAFAVVFYWPTSPPWVVWASAESWVIGPVAEGNTLLVGQWRQERGFRVVALRLDDGRVMPGYDMRPVEPDLFVWWAQLVAEGKWLWVEYRSRVDVGAINPPRQYAILDARTGVRLHGPFPFERKLTPAFSPDGRWMAARKDSVWFVYSTTTGDSVKLRPLPGFTGTEACAGCSFAPNDSTLAVWWSSSTGLESVVEFYEPGTGRLIRRLELPFFLNQWNWNPVDPAHASGRIVREIQGEQVRAGDLWWQAQNLCDRWFKTNWAKHDSRDVLLQILIRDTSRLCLSVRSHQGRYFVSPDRRWVVTVDAERMALWDADPWPRWPWAEAAGIVVGSMVMFARRRRRTVSPQFDGPSGSGLESMSV